MLASPGMGVGRKEGGRVTTPNLLHELEVAVDLARRAASTIMDHYHTPISVEYKEGNEPVTAADRAADRIIGQGLREQFPADGLLSEESADDPARLERERVWIVDPLDGTADFIEHTGDFAVQIALTRGGRPVLGVVYQPVQGLLFHAREGQGAYLVHDGERQRLHVSAVSAPAAMCLVASRTHFSPFIQAAYRALGIERVRQAGGVGVKIGLLARGHCDLYLGTNVCKEWDLCAPHAVLLEAGGRFTNLFGEPIAYNRPGVQDCHGLVASNGQAHAGIVAALAPLRDEMEW
ncbi:MAG: 3'(2'),5'-bisphosphate nucleotidase CysQ [Anaerolineae bacterium]|nr:3'(2'),5'-bisphosphate nucleotidase CysQ [Anaerolineae bacterium]